MKLTELTRYTESVLQINDPTSADEGYYHCEAVFSSGTDSATISSSPAGLYSEFFNSSSDSAVDPDFR